MGEHGEEVVLLLVALPRLAHGPVALSLRQRHALDDRCRDAPVEEIEEAPPRVGQLLLAERPHLRLDFVDRVQEHLPKERQFLHHLGDGVAEPPPLAPVLGAFAVHPGASWLRSARAWASRSAGR